MYRRSAKNGLQESHIPLPAGHGLRRRCDSTELCRDNGLKDIQARSQGTRNELSACSIRIAWDGQASTTPRQENMNDSRVLASEPNPGVTESLCAESTIENGISWLTFFGKDLTVLSACPSAIIHRSPTDRLRNLSLLTSIAFRRASMDPRRQKAHPANLLPDSAKFYSNLLISHQASSRCTAQPTLRWQSHLETVLYLQGCALGHGSAKTCCDETLARQSRGSRPIKSAEVVAPS
nr:hypothetical protein CFP56_03214 [Quercus suber]